MTAEQHLAQARSLAARSGYTITFDLQCRPANAAPGDLFGPGAPPATQLFDNFYYVGMNSVGAYVIETSDGLILIDGLNSEEDARQYIIPGMEALGLDPSQIKYVILTHGHGDHFGGVKFIQETYGARVIASEADWELMSRPFTPRPGSNRPPPRWGPPPTRDMVATDGQTLTLGDATVTLVITPGHTPGTLSLVIPVTDRGQPHALAMWGGTAIPDNPEILRQYVASFTHFEEFTKPAGVDIILSNHPFVDGSLFKMEALRANPD
ncbi:MAG: MBL fold metallo-hydrolase, partial [Sphingomonadales bacterium]